MYRGTKPQQKSEKIKLNNPALSLLKKYVLLSVYIIAAAAAKSLQLCPAL